MIPIVITAAVAALIRTANAQYNYPSPLTLGFGPAAYEGCPAQQIRQSLSWSTLAVSAEPECFNLKDVFTDGDNVISGNVIQNIDFGSFRNYTQDRADGIFNFTWYAGPGAYNPDELYTRVWHDQRNTVGDEDEGAKRMVYVYPDLDCETSPDRSVPGGNLIYSLSCQSDRGGSCEKTDFNVKSFRVVEWDPSTTDGECKDFGLIGAAVHANGRVGMVCVAAVALFVVFLSL